jgi:hypothetical protein
LSEIHGEADGEKVDISELLEEKELAESTDTSLLLLFSNFFAN